MLTRAYRYHIRIGHALSVDENTNSVLVILQHLQLMTEDDGGSIGHWHLRRMIQSNSEQFQFQDIQLQNYPPSYGPWMYLILALVPVAFKNNGTKI